MRNNKVKVSYFCTNCGKPIQLEGKTYFPDRCENCKTRFTPNFLFIVTYLISLLIGSIVIFLLKQYIEIGIILFTGILVMIVLVQRLVEKWFQKEGWIQYKNVKIEKEIKENEKCKK